MEERIVTLVRPRNLFPALSQHASQKRVAAYARVSTDSDEQMNSVDAQKDYFEKLIAANPSWLLVGIYADEGISGTSIRQREAFNRMVTDALAGQFDLILTKSLSRFARNTVDALNVIRKLKDAGVAVYFEKEDINTLDSKGEFLITLMSCLAEEESRSISENVKWGLRKRFSEGKYSLPYKHFLGYQKGPDGTPTLIENEAKIIRAIYRLFLDGYSSTAITKKLAEASIQSPGGKDHWERATVESILQNEKYYGAALLQKSFTADYRTKEKRINRGELPMYYIEDDHDPIVTKAVYDEVQMMLKRRTGRQHTNRSFSGKLICCDCGSLYGPYPAHSTTYNNLIWRCQKRHLHHFPYTPVSLYNELLEGIFHKIIMNWLKCKEDMLHTCTSILNLICAGSIQWTNSIVLDRICTSKVGSDAESLLCRRLVKKVIVHPEYLLEFHIVDDTVMYYQMTQTAPKHSRIPQQLRKQILQEYTNGNPISTISFNYGLSDSSVRSIIRKTEGACNTIPLVCQNCGTQFWGEKSSRRYCSHNCYIEKRFKKQCL